MGRPPALLRFDSSVECEAAAAAMRGRQYVTAVECIRVTMRKE